MSAPLIDVRAVDIVTVEGRPLLRDLTLSLGRERVAVVGRNGVGKTSLLRVLAGHDAPSRGTIRRRGTVVLVPQILDGPSPPGSHGERRRAALSAAWGRDPDLLLLDEPTEDLDGCGRRWLLHRLRRADRGIVVVSHDPQLLAQFEDFFVMAESGGRHFSGRFDQLQGKLTAEADQRQRAYVRTLRDLAHREDHHHRVQQRRRRKAAVGRLHELDRCQSRLRLNERRGSAQVSQARVRSMQNRRIEARRGWARAARRALAVRLPLDVAVPRPPPPDGDPVISLADVSLQRGDRPLFDGVTLDLSRERIAVVGPNGSGKTSLLRVMLGDLAPSGGFVRIRPEHIGAIAQGAEDWVSDEGLLQHLARTSDTADLDTLAQRLVAHRFPLALADRPLRSLSPGERTRAALIGLFQRPALAMLVLDEPTYSLDLVGVAALTEALRAWRGGLVVASHDRTFLEGIGVDRTLVLTGA